MLIAQELERVAPFMVKSTQQKLEASDSAETGVKTVDPSAFTCMLINAVKELSEENRELRAAVCEVNPKARICSTRRGKRAAVPHSP